MKNIKNKDNELFLLRQQTGLNREMFGKCIGRSMPMVRFYEMGLWEVPKKVMDRARCFVDDLLKLFEKYERK